MLIVRLRRSAERRNLFDAVRCLGSAFCPFTLRLRVLKYARSRNGPTACADAPLADFWCEGGVFLSRRKFVLWWMPICSADLPAAVLSLLGASRSFLLLSFNKRKTLYSLRFHKDFAVAPTALLSKCPRIRANRRYSVVGGCETGLLGRLKVANENCFSYNPSSEKRFDSRARIQHRVKQARRGSDHRISSICPSLSPFFQQAPFFVVRSSSLSRRQLAPRYRG